MNKIIILAAVLASVVVSGCAWTVRTARFEVHKDARGAIKETVYIEEEVQQRSFPINKNFGKYLYNQ